MLQQEALMEQCSELLHENETEVNCAKLVQLLAGVTRNYLENTCIIMTSLTNKENRDQQKSDLSYACYAAQNGLPQLPRSKVIYLHSASFALALGKRKFFKILIDANPGFLFLTTSSNFEIDPLLICAIDTNSLDAVSAVLRNEHFIEHEFRESQTHLTHIQECMRQTAQTRSPEISRMLGYIIVVRIPGVLAMLRNDLESMSVIFTCAIFNPEVHRALVRDCIDFATRYCNEPEVLDLLMTSARHTTDLQI